MEGDRVVPVISDLKKSQDRAKRATVSVLTERYPNPDAELEIRRFGVQRVWALLDDRSRHLEMHVSTLGDRREILASSQMFVYITILPLTLVFVLYVHRSPYYLAQDCTELGVGS